VGGGWGGGGGGVLRGWSSISYGQNRITPGGSEKYLARK